jgi:1,4-alpha-glucan branching enzyme
MTNPEQTASLGSIAGVVQTQPRRALCAPDQPISIYEVHLPSWMRVPEEQNRPLTPTEIAPKLAEHLKFMNFTHVQLHSARESDPEELRSLIQYLHRRNLGVILETDQLSNRAPELDADGECANGDVFMGDYRYRWDIAWAQEICAYFSTDPLYRKFRQGQFTHRDLYALDANHILPLSEKLVARPRQSLLAIMPGDVWQKFANLRLLFAFMYLLPGKKLMFMGDEFGQPNFWLPDTSLDWHLVNEMTYHGDTMRWVASLNRFYRDEQALYKTDSIAAGFRWIDTSDAASSVVSFVRHSAGVDEMLLAVFNFTPIPRHNYRVGVPRGGLWREILNSDSREFGGSGQGNFGTGEAAPFGWNFQSHSLILTLPPLAAIVLKAPGSSH